jgi:peptidyl-prolyl cis-trans isomerase B (cyclophilin B)
MMRILLAPVLALAFAAPVPAAENPPTQTQKSQGAPKMESKANHPVAVIETSLGSITLELLPELAPEHVKNFVDLASTGFYNGTKFHRVIPGFMIQGGDPNSKTPDTASWGMGNGPRTVKAEFSPPDKASHVRGTVSMARANDPNSASCQFFIVQSDSTFLDGKYSIFGKVTSGMEVVDAIANSPRGQSDRPNQDIVIKKVTIKKG